MSLDHEWMKKAGPIGLGVFMRVVLPRRKVVCSYRFLVDFRRRSLPDAYQLGI